MAHPGEGKVVTSPDALCAGTRCTKAKDSETCSSERAKCSTMSCDSYVDPDLYCAGTNCTKGGYFWEVDDTATCCGKPTTRRLAAESRQPPPSTRSRGSTATRTAGVSRLAPARRLGWFGADSVTCEKFINDGDCHFPEYLYLDPTTICQNRTCDVKTCCLARPCKENHGCVGCVVKGNLQPFDGTICMNTAAVGEEECESVLGGTWCAFDTEGTGQKWRKGKSIASTVTSASSVFLG